MLENTVLHYLSVQLQHLFICCSLLNRAEKHRHCGSTPCQCWNMRVSPMETFKVCRHLTLIASFFEMKSLSIFKHYIWENISIYLLCKSEDYLTNTKSLKIQTAFFNGQRHHLNSYYFERDHRKAWVVDWKGSSKLI